MKRLSSVILIALLAVFLIPINIEAKTLSDLRKEVEEANADLENKNNQCITYFFLYCLFYMVYF